MVATYLLLTASEGVILSPGMLFGLPKIAFFFFALFSLETRHFSIVETQAFVPNLSPRKNSMRNYRLLGKFTRLGCPCRPYVRTNTPCTSVISVNSPAFIFRWSGSSFRFFSAESYHLPTEMAEANRVESRSSSEDDGSKSTTSNEQYSLYEQNVRRLYLTNLFHPVKMGLTNIEKLHKALGNPMDKVPVVVHIAGTNGKGSVALKTAKTLELHNPDLKVGLFCSPHVSSFRERMQVNGQLISEDEVVELLPKLYNICERHDIPATFFEITTALAFSFYASRETDIVVLETGLGGRLDATNVVASPALTIITSIGLEHTRILGNTIEEIAAEKGGIIKQGRPVLVGPNVPHDVLRKCATDKGASAYYTCEDVMGVAEGELSANDAWNDYDVENARIVKAALILLQESHPQIVGPISDEIIQQGTSQRPPCRFEHVYCENGLEVILDVAHNPPAMDYLVQKIKATYPTANFRVVVGMSSDKDLKKCGQSILQAVDGDITRIHLVEAAHPRAAKLVDMLEATDFRKAKYNLEQPSVTLQIHDAMESAKKNQEILVVCGSVFLMAEAREALGFDEPRDSSYIAEVAGAGFKHGQENFGNSGKLASKR